MNNLKYILLIFILIPISTSSSVPEMIRHALPKVLKKSNKLKVMVIDSGIGYNQTLRNVVRDSSENYVDLLGHGTHVAGIIVNGLSQLDPICSNVDVYSCKFYKKHGQPASESLKRSNECLKLAIAQNVDIINYSAGGGNSDFSIEYSLIKQFTNGGGIFVTAAGNDGKSLVSTNYYPASYGLPSSKTVKLERMVVVENICNTGKLCPSSNFHPLAFSALGENVLSSLPNDKFGRMTGTSQATAAMTHQLIKSVCDSK